MAELTRNGVCYNLKESPFKFDWRGVTYYFSSNMHRNHFKRDVRKREEWFRDSLTRRFKVTIDMPLVADVQLYTIIETRGFYVTIGDVTYESSFDIVVTPDLEGMGIEDG